MGGSGADSLARDLSRLTPSERRVYDFALDCVRRKIYPSECCIAAHLGHKGNGPACRIRRSIIRKVGWVCPVRKSRTGSLGLTVAEREVLTTALAIWEDTREYPSVGLVAATMGRRSKDNWLIETLTKLDRMGLLPFRRKSWVRSTAEQELFIVVSAWHGWSRKKMLCEFRQLYGHEITNRKVSRILKRNGMTAPYRRPPAVPIEERKARVIAERPADFLLRARDDPAAFRRALRAGKPARRGSSGRRVAPA